MQKGRIAPRLILLLAIAGHAQTSISAQAYHLRARLAQARTAARLQQVHSKANVHDKITELVFYTRWLSLSPQSIPAARGLLKTVPATKEEAIALITLADAPEEGDISQGEMTALGQINDGWPRMLARAVLLLPASMKEYVVFLALAADDIHSDFTSHAQKVCRKFPKEFRSAVAALPEEDRTYVRRHVFDAEQCKAIFVGEAE
jgi:hypothetical protein